MSNGLKIANELLNYMEEYANKIGKEPVVTISKAVLDEIIQDLEAIDKKRCGANVEKVIIDEFVPNEALECLENLEKEEEFDVVSQHSSYYYLLSDEALDTIKQALHKLKQYDDLMGKYNIKNIKELEKILERDRFNSIGKSSQYCKNEVVK